MRALVAALLALASCLVLASCGGGEDGSVAMSGHRFDPESMTVRAGDPIEFHNDSSEAHSVTAYGDLLPRGAAYFATGGAESEERARDDISAGLLQQGEKFELTLETPGTYRYFCLPHESDGMTGTIVVNAK